MSAALHALLELLDLEEIEQDVFRGHNEAADLPRLFGGQISAQALVAAGRTVEDRRAHSFHSYFLRPGDPAMPVVFMVDRIRDGSSFSTRRVVALQQDEPIFNASVSFQRTEPGFEHGDAMPEVPDPESLPTWEERLREAGERIPKEARVWLNGERPLEVRSVQGMLLFGDGGLDGPSHFWVRPSGALPDDPVLHQCVLAYGSDMFLIDTMLRKHVAGLARLSVRTASLDHALWFHRDFRMDDWLLFAQESPAAAGGRGFSLARIFTRDARLIASVAQEGLLRTVPQGSSPGR